MKLGIATPVVTNQTGAHARWERTGTIDDVRRIAEQADRLGYDFMTCSEHIGVPDGEAVSRGARYWDPLSTFGYVAACTQRIRLATFVLVLGYHHPLEIAKRYGTLDQISGGRVVLGVGVGTLKAEFDLLGAPFADRGERADDALRALRASLSEPNPSYEGPFYSFGGLTIDPCARQEHVPMWVGGRSRRSARRAVALADGWCPFNVTADEAARWLSELDVPGGFEVVLPPDHPLDPLTDPDDAVSALTVLAQSGTTIASARVVHHSAGHYLEQLEALAGLAAAL
ncbi:MAG: TIGR03619 family F420-dependent LLM class oxidoreductase [Acidobacteriota bacterium]|nr:TIGR03619 family F420-dependent LLM class oxidoreductase [Acidobacteriota bacterium]